MDAAHPRRRDSASAHRLDPGRTIAIALWRGERHGAVVFIRLWRDGTTIDYDCAIAERAADGSWDEPSAWSGGPWMPDPLVRPDDGWDGDDVVWLGLQAELRPLEDEEEWMPAGGAIAETDFVEVAADLPEEAKQALLAQHMAKVDAEMTPDPDEYVVRAVLGAASMRVGAIGVEHGGRSWTVPIESPCGAFIVGIEGPGVATLQPLDRDGRPLGPTRKG